MDQIRNLEESSQPRLRAAFSTKFCGRNTVISLFGTIRGECTNAISYCSFSSPSQKETDGIIGLRPIVPLY